MSKSWKKFVKPLFMACIIVLFALFAYQIPLLQKIPIVVHVMLMVAIAYLWIAVLNVFEKK